ncbi:hypothetical protein CKA38_11205 [Ereboglobus luteus]|uniref:Uncharacterized protein n=1 Tax=Ereboglobus luteus TaxID=1796921 RepID=A0A2U8E4F2_9BACT|nr:hypothetical protein CKA38_11205 [Ereboglobus luteus]
MAPVEIPNSSDQIPKNKSHQTRACTRSGGVPTPDEAQPRLLEFKYWNLEFYWNLITEIWNF